MTLDIRDFLDRRPSEGVARVLLNPFPTPSDATLDSTRNVLLEAGYNITNHRYDNGKSGGYHYFTLTRNPDFPDHQLAFDGNVGAFEGIVAPGVSSTDYFSKTKSTLQELGVEITDWDVSGGRYSISVADVSSDAVATILGAE